MRLIGLAGWSGSGKTTLLTKLIPCLIARGHSVSTLKHAHHRFDVDQPGKDSFLHRTAGATEVLVSSAQRFALMHELRGAPEPSLRELLSLLSPVSLVIVEGYKTRSASETRNPSRGGRQAAARARRSAYRGHRGRRSVAAGHGSVMALDDVERIADTILRYAMPIATLLCAPAGRRE